MDRIIWFLLALWIGHSAGWSSAHRMVATECERTGRFFVGNTVFECTVINEQGGDGDEQRKDPAGEHDR